MGPGHLGVAFAAKPAAPKTHLLALLIASEALDLLSGVFIAIGIERMAVTRTDFESGLQVIKPGSVPWSHGLFPSIMWSLLFASIAYMVTKNRRSSAILGLVVFSHWMLDFIVHPPDLPLLFAGSPEIGLGLWTSGPGMIASAVLEVVLLAGGIFIYLSARNKTKREVEGTSALA